MHTCGTAVATAAKRLGMWEIPFPREPPDTCSLWRCDSGAKAASSVRSWIALFRISRCSRGASTLSREHNPSKLLMRLWATLSLDRFGSAGSPSREVMQLLARFSVRNSGRGWKPCRVVMMLADRFNSVRRVKLSSPAQCDMAFPWKHIDNKSD